MISYYNLNSIYHANIARRSTSFRITLKYKDRKINTLKFQKDLPYHCVGDSKVLSNLAMNV